MDRTCGEEIGVGGGVGRSGARVGLTGKGLYMLDDADDASSTTNGHNVISGHDASLGSSLMHQPIRLLEVHHLQ